MYPEFWEIHVDYLLRLVLIYYAGPMGLALAYYFSPRATTEEMLKLTSKVDETKQDLISKINQTNAKNDELMKLIQSNIQASQRTFSEIKESQETLTQSFKSLKGEVEQIKFKMNSM